MPAFVFNEAAPASAMLLPTARPFVPRSQRRSRAHAERTGAQRRIVVQAERAASQIDPAAERVRAGECERAGASFWTAVVLIPFWMIPAKVPASPPASPVSHLLVMVPLPVRFAVVVPMPFRFTVRRRRIQRAAGAGGEQGRRGIERLEGAGNPPTRETGHHDRARTAQSERAGVTGRTEMQCADRRRAGSKIEASGQGRRLAGACCDRDVKSAADVERIVEGPLALSVSAVPLAASVIAPVLSAVVVPATSVPPLIVVPPE